MTGETPARARDGAARPAFPVGPDAGVPTFPVRRVVGPAAGGDVRGEARRAIEAVLMAATDPVPARDLAELVECGVDLVAALCRELADEYVAEGRGFVLAEVAGGYRYQTHPDLAPYVEQFVLEGQHVRLSAPALETLAIVAYKQPITRGQVSAIRGVNVESTLQTLVQKGYVHEIGRDPGPGLASLYGTTPHFLERLGLASLADLPALGDFVPGPEVVEALERGLRADQDPRLKAPADDAPPAPPAPGAPEPGDPAGV
ncbi:MAG: SMC-Scp complex subunit ScpB [Actinobacteria bacterium]|nr:SMC-Scp complex subunit ScpB [Actinomycetota bacterium]